MAIRTTEQDERLLRVLQDGVGERWSQKLGVVAAALGAVLCGDRHRDGNETDGNEQALHDATARLQ